MIASSRCLSGSILLVGPPGIYSDFEVVIEENSSLLSRAPSPGQALRRLRDNPSVDLVVITPDQPGHAYIELCRNIKFGLANSFVSVIFLLAPNFADLRSDVFRAGADDCIQLPAPKDEILLRLSNAIRVKQATDSLEDATAVITALATAIEGRDPYTCGHVERVATYSVEIAKRIGVDSAELAILKTGAMVHDIGKVAVPDHILNKPGKLDDQEMDIMRRHTTIGAGILQPLRTFREVIPIVRWHHERPNGTGYPDGIEGDQLPLLPRIIAVADCFDAMTTDRPYRSAIPHSECKEILSDSAQKEDLDPMIVSTLIEIMGEHTGSLEDIHSESSTLVITT